MPKNFSFRVTNDTPQSERRAVLRNERAGTTYHEFAAGEADVPRGRFTAHERSVVTGSTPVPQYPALPASSPWASDPVPAEEPLGIDINAVEPVGTHTEVEQSLRGVHGDAGRLLPDAVEQASPGDAQRDAGSLQPMQAARRRRSNRKLDR